MKKKWIIITASVAAVLILGGIGAAFDEEPEKDKNVRSDSASVESYISSDNTVSANPDVDSDLTSVEDASSNSDSSNKETSKAESNPVSSSKTASKSSSTSSLGSSMISNEPASKTTSKTQESLVTSRTTSSALTASKISASSNTPNSQGKSVYKTPSGKKYHFDKECGGKNSQQTTLEEAKRLGLEPCKKCAGG